MMKEKKIIALSLSCTMLAGGLVGMTACGEEELGKDANITVTFAHPITGPDAEFMQTLIKNFNEAHKGDIFIKDSANDEETHYRSLNNSITDKSSPDLAIVHKSRIPYYEHIGRLTPMDGIVEKIGLNRADYVGDSWDAVNIDGSMYAIPYDVLPTILFYNRKLFPEGKGEAWEAEIRSADFTVARMEEMMAEVNVYNARPNNCTYGMAFNYANTDSMFIGFLNQLGGQIVDPANPTTALYNDAKGLKAAETVKSIPDTKDKDGHPVCSGSGSDHLTIYKQGRALFAIDGIWSAPGACDSDNSKVDTGVVLLPKADDSVDRKVGGDSHCFAVFNTAKNPLGVKREAAIAEFVQYLIAHSDYWCNGGKVAVCSEVSESASYQALEWGHLSDELENIISPAKVYTYSTILSPIGEHLSNFIEGKSEAKPTMQAELDASVSESNTYAAGV